ncbi:MAG: T9SS type A sorting domain-containing protein [Chlorobi bacterium]|nr:T9SS type A sorting domain-containing protein [Chlorobiota bacterium]MCI0716121.1 T9SS type A sorting domain-containing protein [Chlorobiota bacterium]
MSYTINSSFYKAHQTSDGGYIDAGVNSIGNTSKMYIVKFNKYGDTLWTKHYNINVNDTYGAYWVEEINDRGFIVGGSGPSSSAGLLKTDSIGTFQWYRTFADGWQTWCVSKTIDSGYILAIRTGNSYGPTDDVRILKTDSLGNTIWDKVFVDNNSEDYISEIKPLDNYGYVALGTKWPIGDSADVYLMRLDSNGDTLWTKTIGGNRSEGGSSIDIANDGGFILSGSSNSFNPNYFFQSYLVKTDSLGNVQWQRTYTTAFNERCFSIRTIPLRGYVFCGQSDSILSFGERAFVRVIDFTGNILHEKFYRPGDDGNRFRSVELTNDGGFILCGYADFEFGALNSYIVRTDSLGNIKPIGISINSNEIPLNAELFQNYPNPFNPETVIKFNINKKEHVKLIIYDVLGRELVTLIEKSLNAGFYSIKFNADNFNLSTGIYFYKLITGNFTSSRKMILIK